MSEDVQQEAELQRQYEAALKETTRLSMARTEKSGTKVIYQSLTTLLVTPIIRRFCLEDPVILKPFWA